MRQTRRVFSALLLLAIAAPAYADVDPSITDAIKKVKPSDYPSANTATILDDQVVVYQPDGQ